MSFFASVLGCP